MTIEKLPKEQNCTGCGACTNVCPVDAITMEYSKATGFSVPVINENKCISCGLCTKTCPSLNETVRENNPTPKFYSFCADDATRAVSSSGGMFSVLAEYVLAQGGYVCGAAFDENMQLRHRIVSSSEELAPLRGSKYVQSNVGDCYARIRKLLNDGKPVFFCGTPCQVAGLYGVLKKPYDNLITADLLCHGTPSQKFLDAYLEEVANGKKVVDMQFRSKRFGWSYKAFVVKFSDGTEYVGTNTPDVKEPYVEGFIKNMMMRYSCYDCKFAECPRRGDFTIGDLWKSDKLDPKSNDRKGTSFVFVNNARAEEIFAELCKDAKYYNELHTEDYAKLPNRVHAKEHPHPARRRFLNLLRHKPFSEAFRNAYEGRYDIGLVGVMGNENIGSILTYYSLYQTLTEMGYSVLPIERPTDSPLKVSDKAKAFWKKWLPADAQFVQYDSIDEMRALNDKCRQFVVGSDQIYLSAMSAKRNHCYFLQWAEDSKNKVAYASSFGGPGARGSEAYYRGLRYYLNRFSFVSSREDDGVNLVNNRLRLDKKAQWTLDPVFLCDTKHFHTLANAFKKDREKPYIGSYVIIPKQSIVNLLQKTREHFPGHGRELLCSRELVSSGRYGQFPELGKYKQSDAFPVGNTLEIIKNSDFFVTDSFHGMCFSVIFRKNFLVMPRDFHDRFHSLLDRIGLGDRIINANLSNFSESLFQPIDYDRVYKKLNAEIARSRKLLADSLGGRTDGALTDMDMMMRYMQQQSQSIQALRAEVAEMQTLLDTLRAKLPDTE